ncbi:ferrochelatase [bacterium]|nr:ferrochelatase [bacterium]
MKKTGILLINLGTPNSAQTKDVRKYLREFLSDPRVIDIPFVFRFLLVNLIIAPFRSPKSAKIYQKIWTEKGSPLLVYGLELKEKLQRLLGENYVVEFGMRYQNPSLEKALETFKTQEFSKIKIIPLFPQYASATTGSVYQKVMEIVKNREVFPSLEFVSNFHSHEGFLEAFAELGKNYLKENYEHVLFSFHGLPERQIRKADFTGSCLSQNCCGRLEEKNYFCYKAQCFETAKNIAKKLELKPEKYTVCFQSRLGKDEWIKPYTGEILKKLAGKGVKKVLVFCPAFICDCLETTYEIGVEYSHIFQTLGGEKLQLAEGLNAHDFWAEGLKRIVIEN